MPETVGRQRGSGDFDHLWSYCCKYRGLMMSSTVKGEGKCSQPVVEVGVQHVGKMEDTVVFVALSVAIVLYMDACKLFSHKMRK
ncbi:hypothetical protein MRB53_005526 [Persea americana]|uniref:Uncharacterized protein n=1 Tax=Persea americana TaxID=3435 RepID=A0ACC2MDU7_PERAE|nr:hypothetical protein MRB53_005526 [Persea americana]